MYLFFVPGEGGLYLELKAILARQPGPAVAEQLTVCQQSLKGKTRQLKAMVSELNMDHPSRPAPLQVFNLIQNVF